MKRGERSPNCTFSGAETDKNAPCVKVSVKLVIINKRARFCLVLSRISRAAFSQEEKSRFGRERADRPFRKNGLSSQQKYVPRMSVSGTPAPRKVCHPTVAAAPQSDPAPTANSSPV